MRAVIVVTVMLVMHADDVNCGSGENDGDHASGGDDGEDEDSVDDDYVDGNVHWRG